MPFVCTGQPCEWFSFVWQQLRSASYFSLDCKDAAVSGGFQCPVIIIRYESIDSSAATATEVLIARARANGIRFAETFFDWRFAGLIFQVGLQFSCDKSWLLWMETFISISISTLNVSDIFTSTGFHSLLVISLPLFCAGILWKGKIFFSSVTPGVSYQLFSPWTLPSCTKIRVRESGYTLPLQIPNKIYSKMRVALWGLRAGLLPWDPLQADRVPLLML